MISSGLFLHIQRKKRPQAKPGGFKNELTASPHSPKLWPTGKCPNLTSEALTLRPALTV